MDVLIEIQSNPKNCKQTFSTAMESTLCVFCRQPLKPWTSDRKVKTQPSRSKRRRLFI